MKITKHLYLVFILSICGCTSSRELTPLPDGPKLALVGTIVAYEANAMKLTMMDNTQYVTDAVSIRIENIVPPRVIYFKCPVLVNPRYDFNKVGTKISFQYRKEEYDNNEFDVGYMSDIIFLDSKEVPISTNDPDSK